MGERERERQKERVRERERERARKHRQQAHTHTHTHTFSNVLNVRRPAFPSFNTIYLSIVTVEIEGPAEGLYRDALPGFTPFAFTNPIFVDTDGNGRFDAPGLPDEIPRTLSDPDIPD